MSGIKWIKITVSMFDDEKIDFIDSLPEADAILVIWIRLLTLAGKCNVGGYIFLTENIPYTDEMLAHKFRRPLNIVRLALETFRKLGMIEQTNEGHIYISNWEKHQNIEGMDKIREQNRIRKKNERERKKLAECNVSHDSHVTVTQSHATDIDIDIDKDKDIEKEIYKEKEIPPKKPKKEKPQKTSYSEFVLLTSEEYSKLVNEFGEKEAQEIISILNNYKGATGKQYKSDYLAIKNWVIERWMEKQQKENMKGGKENAVFRRDTEQRTLTPEEQRFFGITTAD